MVHSSRVEGWRKPEQWRLIFARAANCTNFQNKKWHDLLNTWQLDFHCLPNNITQGPVCSSTHHSPLVPAFHMETQKKKKKSIVWVSIVSCRDWLLMCVLRCVLFSYSISDLGSGGTQVVSMWGLNTGETIEGRWDVFMGHIPTEESNR